VLAPKLPRGRCRRSSRSNEHSRFLDGVGRCAIAVCHDRVAGRERRLVLRGRRDALGALSGPLVQLIDADLHDDHTNILVQFACTVRYLNNTPVSHGASTRITLRLGPDCGTLLATCAGIPADRRRRDLITAARLESVAPAK